MNNKTISAILMSALLNKNEYDKFCEQSYITDSKVNECIMNMYFYMLYSIDNQEKKEEYFQEFKKSYENLDKSQKEIVKQEYIDIIETQEKNKRKIKKKGMMDYE